MSLYQEAFKLKDNPFGTTAPSIERPIVWSGRATLKEDLVEILKASLVTSPSRIIINWGEWGAGKTHAMKYFSQEENLEPISKEMKEKPGYSIYIVCPRRDVLELMYLSIIESIGLKKLRTMIEKIVFESKQMMDIANARDRLERFGFSHAIAGALQALRSRSSRVRTTAARYFYLEASGADLKTIQVPKRIRSGIDMLRTLAQFLKLFVSEDSPYSRFFLWIDEMETMETLTGKDLTDLRFFLRSMVDLVPQGLTIFLNITAKATELESFYTYLGAAVLERVYKVIEFPLMNAGDVVDYVDGLLNSPIYRRHEDKEMLQKKAPEMYRLYPFTADAVLSTYKRLTRHIRRKPTPRNINDALSTVLDLAIRDKKIFENLKNMEKMIDKSFIAKNWDAIKIGVHVTPVM